MNKDDETFVIYEEIETIHTIRCTNKNCDVKDTTNYDDVFDVIASLQESGWRATISGNVYCPKCAKVKLKPKKPVRKKVDPKKVIVKAPIMIKENKSKE